MAIDMLEKIMKVFKDSDIGLTLQIDTIKKDHNRKTTWILCIQ